MIRPLDCKVSIEGAEAEIQISAHRKVKRRRENVIALARVWVKKVTLHHNYQRPVSSFHLIYACVSALKTKANASRCAHMRCMWNGSEIVFFEILSANAQNAQRLF